MPGPTTFSVASANLLNLNLPGLRLYRDPDGWSQEDYARKIAWTGQVLGRLGCDVMGFQELWHHDALADVIESAGLAQSYTLLTPPGEQGKRIACAAAVREDLLIGETQWIEQFPDKFLLQSSGEDAQTSEISVRIDSFSRPVLKFQIKPRSDGKRITIYVAHLKSRRPTAIYREGWYRDDDEFYAKHREGLGYAISTIRRSAEAAALRMILVEELKGTKNPVIVLGDFNDDVDGNTLNILTGQPRYLHPLSTGGGDADLYSANTLQNYRDRRDVYYTHVYQDLRESLDHILVSEEFYDNSHDRIWAFEGLEIVNDHLNRDDHKETGSTDHGIVCASFKYRPA